MRAPAGCNSWFRAYFQPSFAVSTLNKFSFSDEGRSADKEGCHGLSLEGSFSSLVVKYLAGTPIQPIFQRDVVNG